MISINHVTASSAGGAGIVATRLNRGLQNIGYDSKLTTLYAGHLARSPWGLNRLKSLAFADQVILKRIDFNAPVSVLRSLHQADVFSGDKASSEIQHLHWTPGIVRLQNLRPDRPKQKIVITMHDDWFLTGGCHFRLGCNLNQNGCRNCPAVRKPFKGMVQEQFKDKYRFFEANNPAVVVPDARSLSEIRYSPFYKLFHSVRLISNPESGLHNGNNNPRTARSGNDILFVASDLSEKRKRLEVALRYFQKLRNDCPHLNMKLIGSNPPAKLPEGVTYIGRLTQSQLAEEMKNAGKLLFCSVSEKSPLVLGEAKEAGLEILTPDKEIDRLAEQVAYLVENTVHEEITSVSRQYAALYNEVLEDLN